MGENCDTKRYKDLSRALTTIGYSVKEINPDWYRPVSEAIFRVPKNAIIFGFSMGAVIAYLSAKKYPCKSVIFGSLSPLETFTFKDFSEFLMSYMKREPAEKITTDLLKIKVSLKTLKMPYIELAGEREEDLKAHFRIPGTGHYLSKAYIEGIVRLLEV
ncbi:MAG: hypothetical protein RLZZ67_187 [Candidatus Parcubacteria bacterium]